MPIVNNSHATWYPYEALKYMDQPNKDIKQLFPNDTIKYYESNYKNIDYKELLHFLCVSEDLSTWCIKYDLNNCIIYIPSYNKEFNCIDWEYHDGGLYFDGYAQYKWAYDGQYDSQFFQNELYINVFVATIYGGICCHIDKKTSDVRFYAIGADDGSLFITDHLFTNNIPLLKQYLISEISELHIDGINHQMIIENIWNSTLEIETTFKH